MLTLKVLTVSPGRLRPPLKRPAAYQGRARPVRPVCVFPRWSQDAVSSEGFFSSKVVQDELARLQSEGAVAQPSMELYPFMDVAGKRITLDLLEGLSDRSHVFYTRLRLSHDPEAQAYLSWMRATMLEEQGDWEAFFTTKRQFFAVLRNMLSLEETLAAAGDEEGSSLCRDAQVAWLQGRYEEWEAYRQRESGGQVWGQGLAASVDLPGSGSWDEGAAAAAAVVVEVQEDPLWYLGTGI